VRKEIKVGMTPKEVEAIFGRPQDEESVQNTTRWTYPNLTVISENGRVKDVKFQPSRAETRNQSRVRRSAQRVTRVVTHRSSTRDYCVPRTNRTA
jgi:hypothetical protein